MAPRPLGPIDFAAREHHFAHHLAPVYLALEEADRGTFYTATPAVRAELDDRYGIDAVVAERARTGPGGTIVVASIGDLAPITAQRRRADVTVVLAEHGAGQTYTPAQRSYIGGPGRAGVNLILTPGEAAAARSRSAYPRIPAVAVGCPKLDRWEGHPRPLNPRPIVALAWHWDCRVNPETRTAWPEYGAAFLAELAITAELIGFDLIGHAHPRILEQLRPAYLAAGIPVVDDLDDILAVADLFVADNTSALYEAAAVGIATVVLNATFYRRQLEHGLRFWTAPPGPMADTAEEAVALIVDVLYDPAARAAAEVLRETGAAAAYAVPIGQASRSAAMGIVTASHRQRCAVCGIAGHVCTGGSRDRLAYVHSSNTREAGPVAVYRRHDGDFRYAEAKAVELGLLATTDKALPAFLDRRLRNAAAPDDVLATLRRRYAAATLTERQAILDAVNLTPPAGLLAVADQLAASAPPSAASGPPAPSTPSPPTSATGAEEEPTEALAAVDLAASAEVPDGRVGDVLAWVAEDKARAVDALAAEEAGKRRRTLLTELTRIIEEQ